MSVKRVAVHCVDIEDKPGSLQKFLTQSSLSGVDYLCFSAFSCGDNHGRVYVSAKDPKIFENFAGEAGVKQLGQSASLSMALTASVRRQKY